VRNTARPRPNEALARLLPLRTIYSSGEKKRDPTSKRSGHSFVEYWRRRGRTNEAGSEWLESELEAFRGELSEIWKFEMNEEEEFECTEDDSQKVDPKFLCLLRTNFGPDHFA
jgi:hypothetical protein